jgi:hypothetical protein
VSTRPFSPRREGPGDEAKSEATIGGRLIHLVY